MPDNAVRPSVKTSNFRGALDFNFSGGIASWGGKGSPRRFWDDNAQEDVLLVGDAGGFEPYCQCHPHFAIVADVQLHNRPDLLGMLGSTFTEPTLAQPSDQHLILAAYAKWGEECPKFLLGEFAFAIWDKTSRRLFCCRDHIGHRAFLYWRNATRFIFASDAEDILGHRGVPRELNYRKFAGLAVPTGHNFQHDETFHSGIFSLTPGSWMTVAKGGSRQHKYWELRLDTLPAVPNHPAQAYEALREVLFQAVECRIDRDYPASATLSGGLDSSAVVAIAARCLEKQNRELTTVAAVVPEERRAQFSDERDYIDEFQSWPNVRIKYVTARGRGPFDCLGDPSRFAVHPMRSSRFFLIEECEKAAIDSGSHFLMTGAAGEYGITGWNQRYYVDLAVRLRWLALARELKNRRNHRDVSSLRRLAWPILSTLFPLRGQGISVLLAQQFQREYRAQPAFKNRWPLQQRFQAAQVASWIGMHAIERGQAVSLLPKSQPLADKRVLEFCLATPPSMNMRDGYPRYLVRGALDGVLPPRIQWRIDKTPFSPDYNARYTAQLGMAREFVSAIGPRDPVRSVVDIDRIEKLLWLEVDFAKENVAARDWIPCSLYAVNFLRQFSEFRP